MRANLLRSSLLFALLVGITAPLVGCDDTTEHNDFAIDASVVDQAKEDAKPNVDAGEHD